MKLERKINNQYNVVAAICFVFACIVMMLSFAVPAYAQAGNTQIDVSLVASDTQVRADQEFGIVLTVKVGTNSMNAQLGDVRISGLENFVLLGTSNKSQVRIENGSTATILNRAFRLRAKNEGRFEVGPVSISAPGFAGQKSSNTLVISVGSDISPSFTASTNQSDPNNIVEIIDQTASLTQTPVGLKVSWQPMRIYSVGIWLLLFSVAILILYLYQDPRGTYHREEVVANTIN